MFSLYTILTNSHKRRQKISNTNLDDNPQRKHDLERPQKTSINIKEPTNENVKSYKVKTKLV